MLRPRGLIESLRFCCSNAAFLAAFYADLAALGANGFARPLTMADDRLAILLSARAANGFSDIAVDGALCCSD